MARQHWDGFIQQKWFYRFRPRNLKELLECSFYPELDQWFVQYCRSPFSSHYLFCGPFGSGVSLRLQLMIRSWMGYSPTYLYHEIPFPLHNANVLVQNGKRVTSKSGKSGYAIQISDYTERSLCEARVLVFHCARLVAAWHLPLLRAHFKDWLQEFRLVLFLQIDRLSKLAQNFLRDALERGLHEQETRTRFLASTHKSPKQHGGIIQALWSRFSIFSLPYPPLQHILPICQKIARLHHQTISVQHVTLQEVEAVDRNVTVVWNLLQSKQRARRKNRGVIPVGFHISAAANFWKMIQQIAEVSPSVSNTWPEQWFRTWARNYIGPNLCTSRLLGCFPAYFATYAPNKIVARRWFRALNEAIIHLSQGSSVELILRTLFYEMIHFHVQK